MAEEKDKFEEVKEGLNLCEGEEVDPDVEYPDPIVPPSAEADDADSDDDGKEEP